MKPLDRQTRTLFEALREDDEISRAQIDAAWDSFRTTDATRDAERGASSERTVAYVLAGAAAAAIVLWALGITVPRRTVTPGAEHGDYGQAVSEERAREAESSAVRAAGSRPRGTRPSAVAATSALDDVPNPTPPPVETDPAETSRRERPPAETDHPSSLAEEVRLLDAAESALHDGDVKRAKQLLAEHRREFPRGVLTAERRTLEKRLPPPNKLDDE
jgi:TolA-binding protein